MVIFPWQLPVRLLTSHYSTGNSRHFTKTWIILQVNVAYMAYKDTCSISEHSSRAVPLRVDIIGIPEGKEKKKGTETIFEELVSKTPQ